METFGYALDTTWRTLLKDMGAVPADVLRRAGLSDDLLQQPSARLADGDYYRLWESMGAELGDPLFPLRLCQAVRSESFSPPLFAALCSPYLLTAAQRIARYKTLIAPMRLEVAEQHTRVALKFIWPGSLAPPDSLVLTELLFCITLARMGTRENLSPVEVTTTVLPSPLAPYESYIGRPITRGPNHQVTFAVSDARRPFLTSNDELWAVFEPALRKRLAHLEATASTAERVRAALLEGLPGGLLTIDDVAKRLCMSKRTLQRRVEAEHTTYQKILNDTRKDLARHYLEKTQLPAAEISFLLGFEEPNSFYRAFRAWAGTTPEASRKKATAANGRTLPH